MMLKKVGVLVGVLAVLFTTFGCASMQEKPVNAVQDFPIRPITLIVPSTAGGGPDMLGRAIARLSGKHLGQNMVVLDKAGGGNTTGYNELAGSQPDGYTLGIVTPSLIMQPLYGQTQYDYPTALEPIASITSNPWTLIVRADAPWQNLQELIEDAKQHPGKIKFGHAGLGTVTNVVGEMFIQATGVQIEQVPFQGPAEAITAVLGGHVQMYFGGPAEVTEQVRSGNVRVLAIAASKRLNQPDFMDVPTFKEQGVEVVYQNWLGIAVPKGLPPQVKSKLAAGIKAIVEDPEFKQNLGMNIQYFGPEEAAKLWQDDKERLSKLVKETGLAERIAAQKK